MSKDEKQRLILGALQNANNQLSIGEELIAPIKHTIDYTSWSDKLTGRSIYYKGSNFMIMFYKSSSLYDCVVENNSIFTSKDILDCYDYMVNWYKLELEDCLRLTKLKSQLCLY